MRTAIKSTFIVTEGTSDTNILKAVLSTGSESSFVFGKTSGVSHAMTVASSVLSAREESVLLVLDADNSAAEKAEYVRALVGKDGSRFKLIFMEPEIETLFFTDKSALEAALNAPIDPVVWDIAKTAPKSTIQVLIQQNKIQGIDQLLASPALLAAMRNHPKIKEIQEFALAAHA